ncbi:hypothetical protein O3G_MSEX006917 [Manduca sexta]|uniref:Peptidase S1 domain-containing protein n=2 Tax=Manduca sexta TaxID=7130 RepID=A0A921Z485_MANSE|nr:hypothetical protein O3G_MSEX006917 [Manduca sexta]
MISITSERDVAEPRRLHTCVIKFNMWFCVTCVLCVTVAARAYPQNVDTANITQPREKRYGYYYHPPEHIFSTLTPSPYYSNQYPRPNNERPFPPYANLNLPPPPDGDLNPFTPIPLPNSKELPPPGDRSSFPSYSNLNSTLPQCDGTNPNILPTLTNNNEYPQPGDRIFLPPLDDSNLTLPNNGVLNDTSPPFDSDRTSLPREPSQLISSEDEEDPCNPHFSEKPDFLAGGRRISEAKCTEYVWNLERMQEIELKRVSCELKRNWRPAGYFGLAPPAVGGRAALPGEFPHMGAVGWLGLKGEWLFKCGSSLISPKFVLTAAHCSKASSLSTDLADPFPKIVRLSHVEIYFVRHYEFPRNYDVKIERIIVHPNYRPPKKYYDIALMELDHEVGFWQMVHPACLWTSPDVRQLSTIATLTGWGVLKEGTY